MSNTTNSQNNVESTTVCDGSIDVNGWRGGHCTEGFDGAGYYMWASEYPEEGSLVFENLEDALKYANENSQLSED